MPERPERARHADEYREAISQWRLAARTEVKRASSLPSSMFDACDPMLEACLAESVEAMLECLHEPGMDVGRVDGPIEARGERIAPDDLRALPAALGADDGAPDPDAGRTAEYLGVLVDAVATGSDLTRRAVAALLQRDFDLVGDGARGVDADAVRARLDEVLDAPDDPAWAVRLDELCCGVVAELTRARAAEEPPKDDR